MLGDGLDVGGDDGYLLHPVGDVEEGGLAVRGLEDKEHVGQASLVVPLPRHGLRPDACDGAVTCVTRYGAGESAARLWCHTRVQRNEFGDGAQVGSWASYFGGEGRLQDHCGKHFDSGVPSTVMG